MSFVEGDDITRKQFVRCHIATVEEGFIVRGRADSIGGHRRVIASYQEISEALFQFADIARPWVVHAEMTDDPVAALGGEIDGVLSVQNAFHENDDELAQLIFLSVNQRAERGGMDGVRTDSEEKVLSELTAATGLLQINVRGGDDFAFERDRRGVANSLKLPGLQQPQ